MVLVFLPITFWLAWLTWNDAPPILKIHTTAIFLLFLTGAVLCIVELVRCALLLYGKHGYELITSTLVGVKDKVGDYYGRYAEPYYLIFSSNGEYPIPLKSYKWSKMYDLSYEGVYNYSHVGDEFYLVLDRKGRILVAYNKKLFELQDN